MRLTTWNVNGIRNPFSYPPWNTARTFPAMFDILNTDIIVMQELKIQRKDLRDDMVLLDGWDCYFSLPKHKKGYSGVGIYTRNAVCAPIAAEEGLLGVLPSPNGTPYRDLPEEESIGGYPTLSQVTDFGIDPAALDAEGRCLVLEFPAFILFGVYSPANSNGLRDDFRHAFIRALDARIRNLIRSGKNVVLVGDLNVSRDERDTANAGTECQKSGVSHEEYISTPNRRIFNQLVIDGEVVAPRDEEREQGVLWDTTRGFHPERKAMYTHWEQKINARPGNFGSRIDFILVSESMKAWVKDANIQEGLLGSDHCPVFVDFHDTISTLGQDEEGVELVDVMNPPGVFEKGVRKQGWKVGGVPEFSAKRMPEFDKRRSIMSMFSAGKAAKTKPEKDVAIEVKGSANEVKATSETVSSSTPPAKSSLEEPSNHETAGAVPLTLKRKVSTPAAKDKVSVKRQKSNGGEAQSSKGQQQSLKGFFQTRESGASASASPTKADAAIAGQSPRSSAVVNGGNDAAQRSPCSSALFNGDTTHHHVQSTPLATTTSKAALNGSRAASSTTSPRKAPSTPPPPLRTSPTPTSSPSLSQISDQLAANEASQRSWSTLFAKPLAPLCEGHSEPCKTMQTKKKGSNQGRSFWMCARPLGPSGEKERGTGWRCGTFIWCSDWGGGRGREKEGRG